MLELLRNSSSDSLLPHYTLVLSLMHFPSLTKVFITPLLTLNSKQVASAFENKFTNIF